MRIAQFADIFCGIASSELMPSECQFISEGVAVYDAEFLAL